MIWSCVSNSKCLKCNVPDLRVKVALKLYFHTGVFMQRSPKVVLWFQINKIIINIKILKIFIDLFFITYIFLYYDEPKKFSFTYCTNKNCEVF